jgi:hypothetical protein
MNGSESGRAGQDTDSANGAGLLDDLLAAFGGPLDAEPDDDVAWADSLAPQQHVIHRARPRCLPRGANLITLDHAPGIDLSAVCDLWETEDAFVRLCHIQTEDQDFRTLEPTPAQQELISAYHAHNWVMVTKYRQAKVSTISLMLLLRDCMYIAGLEGRIVAEKLDTASRLMQRLKIAYKYLPDSLKVPLEKGTEFTNSKVRFAHGGSIQIITAASDSPGVGDSIDRLVMTEFGEVPLAFQANVLANLFPTISKRPNAKFILETTPGKSGTQHQELWRNACEGKNKFYALFLRWWLDASCVLPVEPGFARTQEEEEYASRHPGITDAHLAYRRNALKQDFAGAPHKFPSKFPSHPDDGWLGAGVQVLPVDKLEPLLLNSVRDGTLPLDECGIKLKPGVVKIPGRPYMVTVDPGNFASKGDYSAIQLWDAITWEELGVFEQREDPVLLAQRAMRVGEAWGQSGRATGGSDRPALLVIEGNAAACIGVAVAAGYKNLYWTKPRTPGWYATGKSLRTGEGDLIKALHDGDIQLTFTATIQQCLDYDGAAKENRIKDEEGNTSHFERVRTTLMAAAVLSHTRFVDKSDQARAGATTNSHAAQRDSGYTATDLPPNVVRVADFAPRQPRRAAVTPFRPPRRA